MIMTPIGFCLLLMQDFSAKINDPTSSGAVFFAVCRGKVCPFSDLLMSVAKHLLFISSKQSTMLLEENDGFLLLTSYCQVAAAFLVERSDINKILIPLT